MGNPTGLIVAGVVMFTVLGLISLLAHIYNLNNIKSKTVGDGQHGTARFAPKEEIRKTYKHVPYEPEKWRIQAKNGETPTMPNGEPLPQGIVVGCKGKVTTTALVDDQDVHALMIGAAGVGKTAYFLYPNIEYACASGMSFISTDTKGDIYRSYGDIARKYYGYNISVLDLRNPTKSHGNNLLHLVNKYIDLYEVSVKEKKPNISYKAKAEKYAKIISKTIIMSGMDAASFGQNAYFYDAAEGLLTSAILLVAEFGPKEKRHIVSVFKIIQDLLAPSKVKGQTQFKQLLDKLPPEHKARWFAGAALNSGEQSMMSVMSTAMSRLNAFLDTELEQILCFDTEIDAEKFCSEKSAIFIVMPEEDDTKYFMVSLILQQFYREILTVADENNGKLKNRVMMYLDEFGTLPKIQSAELMFSAGRSRRISIVPIIQSFAQLNKNYGTEGAEIITDNTQLTIFGGFAPNSKSAEVLSKAMGSRTVMSGSVSRGKNDPSQSLQMIERPLMTPDELKSMPKGQFIVMKTGHNPMKIKLKLFFKWGIKFEKPFSLDEQQVREVKYLNKRELETAINELYGGEELSEEEIQAALAKAGQIHSPNRSLTEQEIERNKAKKKDKDKNSKGGGQSIAKNNVPMPKMNNVK